MQDNIAKINFPYDEKTEVKMGVDYIKPKQSANTFFKFMKELSHLTSCLEKMAIPPRYNWEDISYMKLEFKKIAYPMVCFCDIHLNRLESHTLGYGEFGVGLSKYWGIRKGLQPIKYLNPKSPLADDFRSVFKSSLSTDSTEEVEPYNNHLLTELLFTKPISGMMEGREEITLFHDEREWRYVPDMNNSDTELPQIVPVKKALKSMLNVYSLGIEEKPDIWLNFTPNDIRYLLVRRNKNKKQLIDFINSMEMSDDIRDDLKSKIHVLQDIGEDL